LNDVVEMCRDERVRTLVLSGQPELEAGTQQGCTVSLATHIIVIVIVIHCT